MPFLLHGWQFIQYKIDTLSDAIFEGFEYVLRLYVISHRLTKVFSFDGIYKIIFCISTGVFQLKYSVFVSKQQKKILITGKQTKQNQNINKKKEALEKYKYIRNIHRANLAFVSNFEWKIKWWIQV